MPFFDLAHFLVQAPISILLNDWSILDDKSEVAICYKF